MPPINNINVDFLRAVFREEKKLLKMTDVKTINVPRYKEISVLEIMEELKGDTQVMQYIPNITAKGKQVDRVFFFNIVNTIRPEYMHKLIEFA